MTAATAAYCVMGNPIAHSLSPWIHARFAQLTVESISYTAQLVPTDGLAEALRDFAQQGGQGCNITVPFKLEAAQLADSRSQRVQLAGAANTLVLHGDGRIHADNTDGLGLVADITRNAALPLAGRDLLLLGAGGAAAGALGPLLEQRPRSITIANRSPERAQALAQSHAALAGQYQAALYACGFAELAGSFDIIINATASSLAGATLPISSGVLRPGCLAYDMMYGPAAQGFLDWAALHGAQPRDGLGMLVEQAAEAFALWRSVRPPAAQVLAELRAHLA